MSKNIEIKVIETQNLQSKEIKVLVDEDPINLANEPEPTEITWNIVTNDGWEFVQPHGHGISINHGKFKKAPDPMDPKKTQMWIRKSKGPHGEYVKYAIKLTKTDASGTTTLIFDPAINNGD